MDESFAGAVAVNPFTLRQAAGWRLPPLALAMAGLLQSAGTAAQIQTTTESWGNVSSSESVQGEITITFSYLALVTPQVNGAPIGPDLSWFDYYDPRTTSQGQALFSQFLATSGPAPMTVEVGGVPVEVLSWTPQLYEAYDEFIDANYETSYYTLQSQGTTVQLTSGDAPDASVPIGDRGECFSAGLNGPTNFDPFTGYFADCFGGDNFDVAPGTVNTNTHTTYYTVFVEEQTGNEDWQGRLFYTLTPAASASAATASLTQQLDLSETRRVDDHAVQFRGEVGGVARFEQGFAGQLGDGAVQEALAALLHAQEEEPRGDGAPVVLSWSAPALVENTTDLVEQQSAIETGTRNSTIVSTQTSTRGLGDDPVTVSIGDGVDYALSPGETHTHTLTTQLTEQLTTTVTTDRWLTTSTYLLTPRETVTSSRGHLTRALAATDYRRNDSHATQLLGVVNGTTLFDQRIDGRLAEGPAQARLAALAQPTGYALDGAPILVAWSAPQFLGSTTSLLERGTSTRTSTQQSTVVTTQTSIRDADDAAVVVPYGERGACTDSGASGIATGEAPAGRLATCEGGTDYALSPGETNTHTHTTAVTETLTTTLTTEDWLNTSAYQVSGTAVPIGLSHAAVSDALFDDGDFAGRQRAVLDSALEATAGQNGFAPWVMLHASDANRDANDGGAGHRRTAHGVSGGFAFRLGDGARLGLALDHSEHDLDVDGQQERSDIELLRMAAGMVLLMPADWRLDLMAGHGWSDIATARGGAANGGLSRANYDAGLWFSSLRLGQQLALNRSLLRPFAEINWMRADLDGFAESGGVALRGREEAQARTELVAGAQFDLRWDLDSGSRLGLTAELLGGAVVDGTERERTVAFSATPDQLLRTSSAEENRGFARGRIGLSYGTAEGLRFHLGMDGRVAEDQDSWRANAGVSVSF